LQFLFYAKRNNNVFSKINIREKYFMSELEVIATFDTPETAKDGAKLLNSWFSWIMEGSPDDDVDGISEAFDQFDLSLDDFSLEDIDLEWDEIPEARLEGNKIVVVLESKSGVDTVRELFEAMGAYEVSVEGEED
jgi:hypothetical protein